MALHARPLPSRPTAGSPHPLRPDAALTPPVPTGTPPPGVQPPGVQPVATPGASRADATNVTRSMSSTSAASVAPDRRPWYRQEPWLVWMLAAVLPLVGGMAAPDGVVALAAPLRLAAGALSALCLLVAMLLLVRQGPFRSAVARPNRSVARSGAGARPRRR